MTIMTGKRSSRVNGDVLHDALILSGSRKRELPEEFTHLVPECDERSLEQSIASNIESRKELSYIIVASLESVADVSPPHIARMLHRVPTISPAWSANSVIYKIQDISSQIHKTVRSPEADVLHQGIYGSRKLVELYKWMQTSEQAVNVKDIADLFWVAGRLPADGRVLKNLLNWLRDQ